MDWVTKLEQSVMDGWRMGVWWRLYGLNYQLQRDRYISGWQA